MAQWSERASVSIDLLRGLAALAVFGCHLRDAWCVPYAEVPAPSRLVQAAYLATAFGHEAVIVFFVLSGMLVGGGVVAALRGDRWSASHYARQRATRLYVVLLPALVMTAFWDLVGRAGPGGATHYDVERGTIAVFTGNLGFLQGTLVPSFGSNQPLWSLANEACYYAVFPLLLVPLWQRRGWTRAGLGAAALVLSGLRNPTIPEGFPLWLLGVVVWWCPLRPWMAHRLAPLVGTGLLLGTLGVSFSRVLPPGFATDLCVGLGTATLLLTLRAQRGQPHPALATVAKRLSGCSYTLYVVHMPLIVCLVAWRLPAGRVLPTPAAALELIAFAAAIGSYAYAVAQLTEARTDAVRAWLTRR